MPQDPAVYVGDAALTAADLLNTVASLSFWPDNIETWFVQTKSQFCLKELTSNQTKFDYCVQSMSQEVSMKILNLISNPLDEDLYGHLMEQLLHMYMHKNYASIEAFPSLGIYCLLP